MAVFGGCVLISFRYFSALLSDVSYLIYYDLCASTDSVYVFMCKYGQCLRVYVQVWTVFTCLCVGMDSVYVFMCKYRQCLCVSMDSVYVFMCKYGQCLCVSMDSVSNSSKHISPLTKFVT
jgi:hypothetical protein